MEHQKYETNYLFIHHRLSFSRKFKTHLVGVISVQLTHSSFYGLLIISYNLSLDPVNMFYTSFKRNSINIDGIFAN